MSEHANWSLFRVSDRRQFDEVSLQTIEFFFTALPHALRVDWLMWREGFQGWRPFSELDQILTHLRPSSQADELSVPPPVPKEVVKLSEHLTRTGQTRTAHGRSQTKSQMTKTKSIQFRDPQVVNVVTLADEGTLSLMLESQAATDDRNNSRYQRRFKIKIMTANGPVENQTTNASVSGFRLRDPLPLGLPRFFHVEVNLGADGKVTLLCSAVPEKGSSAITRIRIQVNDNLNAFKAALMRAA